MIGDLMPYFNYHGRNKKMIREGQLLDYFYDEREGKIYLFLLFKNGLKVPIKEERWQEYYQLLNEYCVKGGVYEENI